MDINPDEMTPLMSPDDDPDDTEPAGAEGGRVNPIFDPADLPEGGEQFGMYDLRPRGRPREPATAETSFSTDPVDTMLLQGARPKTKMVTNPVTGKPILQRMLEDAKLEVESEFPYLDGVEIGVRDGRTMIRDGLDENATWRPLKTLDGSLTKNFSKELKERLGPSTDEILERNNARTQELEQQNLQDKEIRDATDTSPEDRRAAEARIAAREEEIQELERESEAVEERMSLRDRVRAIFKKYGVGVLGVLVAAGTVIGVILEALQRGLAGVAQGVGRGLKAIGKKIGELLPGAIGAIVSFLFRTAGEAVGFLAKNAWLLIVAVVVFLIERYKKKST